MEKQLYVGDYVFMNDTYHVAERNRGRVFQVRSSVQEIGGTACVFLRHYSGAYAVDGLTKISADEAEEALIARIGTELVEALERCADNETNDEETQEWREDLSEEETMLVEIWDQRYADGCESILKSMIEKKDESKLGEPRTQGVVMGDMIWHK